MTQFITSYFQTVLTRYDFCNAFGVSAALSLELVFHNRVYRKSEAILKTDHYWPSRLIGYGKVLQVILHIFTTFSVTTPLWNVQNLRLIGAVGTVCVVSEIVWKSHMVPRTTENLLSHRVVCGLSHAVNITAKALNIIATGALLRRYSLTAMVAGGLAMTILSGANLWYDWQQLGRLRGDYKVSVGSKRR